MSKVFVIDDSIGACIAIERILGAAGYDVVWERQGETGLMTIEKHAPDLVLCDVVMPDIDGYEVCRSIRENPLLEGVPVVMMSGIVDDEVRQRAREAGATSVLAKPFTPEELTEVVGTALGETPAPDAHEETGAVEVAEPWEGVLGTFETLGALAFSCVVDDGGEVVARSSRTPGEASAVAPELVRLARQAGELAQRLGHRALHGLVLESDEAAVVLRRLDGDHLLMVALEDRRALGKARYLARQAS